MSRDLIKSVDRRTLNGGALMVAAVLTFGLLMALIATAPGVFAAYDPESATGLILDANNTVYMAFNNSNQTNLTFGIWYADGARYWSTTQDNITGVHIITVPDGQFIANITAPGGYLIAFRSLDFGTILDTGFKAMLLSAFGANLGPVAFVIILGVGIAAISIGRYAGLPIFASVLIILAEYSYIPSWPIYVLVFVGVVFGAKALYDLLGAGG